MAELCGSAKKLTISECGIDELDYVPLTQRRKLLRATKWHSGQGGIFENGSESQTVYALTFNFRFKNEHYL